MEIPSSRSQPIALSASTEAQVYFLFSAAIGVTAVGTWIGMQYASQIMTSGMFFGLIIAELAIIFTSRLWMNRSPWNVLLFGAFPLISGITIAPMLLMVSTEYVNGNAILLNALVSTVFMASAAAVFARTTSWNLGVLGRGLFFAIIGLLAFALLQIFIPALQTTQSELLFSGAGVVIFALFTAYDVQRVSHLSRLGGNPFMLALSLYLDIFNLFIYILRLMMVLSGNRR